MAQPNRICGRDRFGFLAITCFIDFTSLYLFWAKKMPYGFERVILFCACFCVTGCTIFRFIDRVYLTDVAVEHYRFGKLRRRAFWSEIAMACTIRDYRSNVKGGGIPKIVLIPEGCVKYDKDVWYGLEYLRVMRDRVFWVDDATPIRKFIEQHHGEIVCR